MEPDESTATASFGETLVIDRPLDAENVASPLVRTANHGSDALKVLRPG